MTKKDYIKLAEAMEGSRPLANGPGMHCGIESKTQALQWMTTVEHLTETLASDNPRFNKGLFLDACGYFQAQKEVRDDHEY